MTDPSPEVVAAALALAEAVDKDGYAKRFWVKASRTVHDGLEPFPSIR